MMRMQATIRIAGDAAPPAIGPIGSAPVFTHRCAEPLASLSQDWLLPGLERVPVDSVAMLEPNERFIEAFMLGLNVEMGRELLWRDFVVIDPRATFFRRFWRTVNPKGDGDIAPIAIGSDIARRKQAGRNPASKSCCSCAAFCSVAIRPLSCTRCRSDGGNGRQPGPMDSEIHPLFRGSLQPDVTFFGFDLDPPMSRPANPGWYFVIQQQPTEPRFGFDVEIDFGQATHVPLGAPPAVIALPPERRGRSTLHTWRRSRASNRCASRFTRPS
jgi:hypothetical protein